MALEAHAVEVEPAPSVKSMLHGKVIQSQSREIVANVFAFMKREAEFGQQIPLRCVTKRVIAATGVSERSIRRIQREAEVVYSGGATSFASPRSKKRKARRSKSVLLSESGDITQRSAPNPQDKGDLKSKGSKEKEKADKMYPSLEDMKVDQLSKAQRPFDAAEAFMMQHQQRTAGAPSMPSMPSMPSNGISYPSIGGPGMYPSMNPHGTMQIQEVTASAPPPYSLAPTAPSAVDPAHNARSLTQYSSPLYPSLNDYMGLDLSPATIAMNMPEYAAMAVVPVPSMQVQPVTTSTGMVAPLSGNSLGLQRAQVTHGIRELTVCKDAQGKVGLRVQTVNSGVFVCVVVKGSPAAMAGLRFGDQILQVNGNIVAGYTMDQVHKLFKVSPINGISVIVRDRPFERTVTLHKDSTGHVGFHFKEGKIVGLVQDSSAARNGLLTDHHVLEVNGQNVVGVPDKDITAIINEGGPTITITIIPSFVYDHMIKKMSSNLLKSAMDHSIPNV